MKIFHQRANFIIMYFGMVSNTKYLPYMHYIVPVRYILKCSNKPKLKKSKQIFEDKRNGTSLHE